VSVAVEVNGGARRAEHPARLLLDWLRDDLGLTGTKYGCGEGECGACTVLVDGEARLACLTTIGTVAGRVVTTIEGLVDEPVAAAVMDTLLAVDGVQCGFCTPGVVASLTAASPPDPASAIAGNLCRCTGYRPLVASATSARLEHLHPDPLETVATAGYRRPDDLATALRLLADHPFTVMAGGTDLLVKNELEAPILDITGLAELTEISATADSVRIGAGVTFTELLASDLVQTWCRPLSQAAAVVGGRQIQNQGTIGGNVANASPAADTLPVLAVLNAAVELRTVGARRLVPVEKFCTGPGRTDLQPGELITAIIIPKAPPESLAFFVKVGPRRAQAISIVSVALRARTDGNRLRGVRVSYGAVSPVVTTDPEVATLLESAPLTTDLVRAAASRSGAVPIGDIRASATYRKRLLAGVLLRGFADAGMLQAV
jgi:xanthine dehydrogenase small subunit